MDNNKQKEYSLPQRWTILLPKDEVANFEESDFKIISKVDNLYSDEYQIVLIEALTNGSNYRPDDVLLITQALAVHEEWTNAVITTLGDSIDIGADLYPWEGGGNTFIGDMLTDMERLHFLMLYLYTENKVRIEIEDIKVRKSKEETPIALKDNVSALFLDDLYSAIYKEEEIVLWWASIIEDQGLFLVILDETDDDEDDDDDEPANALYPWGDIYDDDDYDYRDDYYKRYY